MNSSDPENQCAGGHLKKRLSGVALVFAVYGVAAIILTVCWPALQQSLLLAIIGPPLLLAVWLVSGIIIGKMVLNREDGMKRFGASLGYAALLLIIVLGIYFVFTINYYNTHPNTWNGL
jgi:hypothetical protein